MFVLRLLEFILWSIGRFYGLVFIAVGGIFFYWTARGVVAYSNGVRTTWSEPAVCVLGAIIGGLSLWVGIRLVQSGIPRDPRSYSKHLADEMELVERAMKLERTDPAAAQQLLDDYFIRQTAATEARQVELRRQAGYSPAAAVELRRELEEELAIHASFRKDVPKDVPAHTHAAILAQMDAADRAIQEELVQLNATIQRLSVR